MKKLSVVFYLDRDSGVLSDVVHPTAAWVTAGEGIATVKFDGTACLWRGGQLWKRYDRKLNKAAFARQQRGEPLDPTDESLFKTPPEGFEPCASAPDPVTLHWPGWVPVSETDPADQWHRQAMVQWPAEKRVEGQTYELVGPALSKNPYSLTTHALWAHGSEVAEVPDRTFDGLRRFLTEHTIEGLVFHHPDGRMAKLRRKDFGLFWVQEDTRAPRKTSRPRRG